jgi:methyl-accepting chemotaxis protein
LQKSFSKGRGIVGDRATNYLRNRVLQRGVGVYMLFGDASSGGLYIDIAIMVIVFFFIFYEITLQQRTKKRLRDLEKRIVSLEQEQSGMFAGLEEKANSLQEIIFEKANPITNKLSELSQKTKAILEKNEAIRQELEQKTGSLQASVDDTAAQFSSSHDAIRKTVQEGRNEIERMAKDVGEFSEEIRKMKDFIRERTIDLEL